MRDKKKKERRGLRKRGAENSPISPPLDPRLILFQIQEILFQAAVIADQNVGKTNCANEEYCFSCKCEQVDQGN